MALRRFGAAAVFAAAGLAGQAAGQVLSHSDFDEGVTDGWECTGGSVLDPAGGNPGGFLHVPLSDWMWVSLWNEQAGTPLVGDLTRHGGRLEVKADLRVFTLNNFFGDPMPPSWFPVVIQFVDATDPTVSVYTTNFDGMPAIEDGWTTYTFHVPDPTGTTLPEGWGGTGDEDPVTFEPRLPAGRTYKSVMENVGFAVVTTAQPGFFYAASFWEVGYDNVRVSLAGAPGPCYANCDESTTSPVLNVGDFTCFLQRFAAGEAYANCDESTTAPALNVGDFTCFLQRFAAGCQ